MIDGILTTCFLRITFRIVALEKPALLRLLIADIIPLVLRVIMRVPLLANVVRKNEIRGAEIFILVYAEVIAEHKRRLLDRAKQRVP